MERLLDEVAHHWPGWSAPCLAGLLMGRVQQFSSYFAPLEDQLAVADIKTTDCDPSIIKALQANGKQMAIPYDLGPYVVFYNNGTVPARR